MSEPPFPPWWGEFNLETGQCGLWCVGPMRMWVRRLPGEWQVARDSVGDPFSAEVSLQIPAETAMEETALSRFSFRRTGEAITVLPRLADRPVISRPAQPLFIPAGEEVTLYVSSPLWLMLEGGEPRRQLQEFPVVRPSDTWFGPMTREGGLCYASSTRALTGTRDFPHSPHRAVTPVRIRNRAEGPLSLERLNLPVPVLTLYRGANGALWTQRVTLDREEAAGELAQLQLDSAAPEEAGESERIAAPRKTAEKNLAIQAFSRLFG